jgi:phosphoserine phosphatase
MLAFASVVIDVDSTLSGIEGIDFLAARRSKDVEATIVALTDRAMRGDVALEAVYGVRLTIIRPTRADVAALAEAYQSAIAPGAAEAIAAMRRAGARLTLVSGGVREAIVPMARALGFADDELHAVALTFDEHGNYLSFDEHSPLTTQRGKPEVVKNLIADRRLPRRVLAVGDGATDVLLQGVADVFAVFTAFASRPSVVAQADVEIASFAELERVVREGSRG